MTTSGKKILNACSVYKSWLQYIINQYILKTNVTPYRYGKTDTKLFIIQSTRWNYKTFNVELSKITRNSINI